MDPKNKEIKVPHDHLRPAVPFDYDIRARFRATDPCSIIFDPSAKLKALFQEDLSLSENLLNLLTKGEILYNWAASILVLKVSETLVVKVTNEQAAFTEHSSLSFLQEHLPSFPAPRPHGLVRLSNTHLLFMTFIPGQDLEKVWPQLDNHQKQSITNQLGPLFHQLRSIPYQSSTALGGVGGDGCKDQRRYLRTSTKPITTDEEFQDFILSGSSASVSFNRLISDLVPESTVKIVFTHGDVRPANIMVQQDEGKSWRVVSIVDWEMSGFYPDYWECIKATNNLTPAESTDWYQFLPDPISPSTYSITWLVDRLLDRNMVNS